MDQFLSNLVWWYIDRPDWSLHFDTSVNDLDFCWHDFEEYAFHILQCWDTSELICFKLGMMLNTTKLQFDSSLDDHDVHSRSQGYGES